MYANEVEKKKEKEKIPKIKINYNIYILFVINLDIYRIHLEENHVPVFCTYNRFIQYTVILWLHTWNAEDSEGESEKKPGTFLLYPDSVLV